MALLDVCRQPEKVQDVVFAAIPVGQRLRCAEVSPAWRAALAAPHRWAVVDLRAGVPQSRARGALLAAAQRAHGGLEELAVLKHTGEDTAPLLRIVQVSPRLRVLRVEGARYVNGACGLSVPEVRALLAAAPSICELFVDLRTEDKHIRSIVSALRGEGEFLRLRVRLFIHPEDVDWPAEHFPALLSALASHPTLRGLDISCLVANGACDAILQLAAARRLAYVALRGCNVSEPSLSALVRLVQSGVEELIVDNSLLPIPGHRPLLLPCRAASAEFVAALRDSRSLRVLQL